MSRPLFEHRHYVKLASWAQGLKYLPGVDQKAVIISLANALQNTNPHFDRTRFITTAEGRPLNWRDQS